MASTEQVEQSLKDLNEAVSFGMDNAEPERAFESICFADVALNKLISNGVIQVPPEDELNYFRLTSAYYDFRFLAFMEIAREWCEDNGIPYRAKER